jgi:hypothetical protein
MKGLCLKDIDTYRYVESNSSTNLDNLSANNGNITVGLYISFVVPFPFSFIANLGAPYF